MRNYVLHLSTSTAHSIRSRIPQIQTGGVRCLCFAALCGLYVSLQVSCLKSDALYFPVHLFFSLFVALLNISGTEVWLVHCFKEPVTFPLLKISVYALTSLHTSQSVLVKGNAKQDKVLFYLLSMEHPLLLADGIYQVDVFLRMYDHLTGGVFYCILRELFAYIQLTLFDALSL